MVMVKGAPGAFRSGSKAPDSSQILYHLGSTGAASYRGARVSSDMLFSAFRSRRQRAVYRADVSRETVWGDSWKRAEITSSTLGSSTVISATWAVAQNLTSDAGNIDLGNREDGNVSVGFFQLKGLLKALPFSF